MSSPPPPLASQLLPPQKEFATLLSAVERPKQDLGAVLIDIGVGLHAGVPQLYCAQEARATAFPCPFCAPCRVSLARHRTSRAPRRQLDCIIMYVLFLWRQRERSALLQPPPHVQVLPERLLDKQSAVASIPHVKLALGRLTDAILAPFVSPLRAVCFLQTWQAPALNRGLIAGATAVCFLEPLWALAVGLWPLVIGSVLPFLGCASQLPPSSTQPLSHLTNPVAATRSMQVPPVRTAITHKPLSHRPHTRPGTYRPSSTPTTPR